MKDKISTRIKVNNEDWDSNPFFIEIIFEKQTNTKRISASFQSTYTTWRVTTIGYKPKEIGELNTDNAQINILNRICDKDFKWVYEYYKDECKYYKKFEVE